VPATKRSSKKQSSSPQKPTTNRRGNKRSVAGVKTVSSFPPKGLSLRTLTPSPSHSLRRRSRPKDQAPECGCLPISLIARDEASARFGAKCCSGLSESSPSRRKDQKTTHTRVRPDRRSKLHQALLARSIRRPRWPLSAASRWRVGASQQGQLVARTTK
jgi:hypothetical protein